MVAENVQRGGTTLIDSHLATGLDSVVAGSDWAVARALDAHRDFVVGDVLFYAFTGLTVASAATLAAGALMSPSGSQSAVSCRIRLRVLSGWGLAACWSRRPPLSSPYWFSGERPPRRIRRGRPLQRGPGGRALALPLGALLSSRGKPRAPRRAWRIQTQLIVRSKDCRGGPLGSLGATRWCP